MCLLSNKENSKKGITRIRFDKDGYVTCWKVYRNYDPYVSPDSKKTLYPVYRTTFGEVSNGWIRSDRKSKIAGRESSDYVSQAFGTIDVNRGIHVYTTASHAKYRCGTYSVVVRVRCHKSQLVAASRDRSEAVFMKVFLKKDDYDKAVK